MSIYPKGNNLGRVMNESDLFSSFASAVTGSNRGPDEVVYQATEAIDLTEGLNPPQLEAVLHAGSPVLVVAGAGSGKTRVLTRRIAYLVANRGVHPGSILAITFTNKAAAEMRSRVAELVGKRANVMWVSTFHSACVRILRRDADRLGMKKTFSIYDDTDSRRLMALVLRELNLDPKKFQVRTLLNWISNAKNELLSPAEAAEGKPEVFAQVAEEYQRRLRAANAVDFDDLIALTVKLLKQNPDILESYRRRFRHVLVDEYQDTNHAQYVLVKTLCEASDPNDETKIPAPELMVVGDSDQSIYAFRGATIRNILDFEADFPGARTILLEQNYRSTQSILSAANAVIQNNRGRPKKRLWSDAGDGAKIVGYVADSEHDEARFVSREIDALNDDHGGRFGDVAVFYRTNAQSRPFEEVFIREGIPYKVVGGVRFYERKEVRDAIAYLRAIANPADEVSTRRILNVPKRGIGERAEVVLEMFAAAQGISFGDAIGRAAEAPGMPTRSLKQIESFAELMAKHQEMVVNEVPADEIVRSILSESGLLSELENSDDPQDQTRAENLYELIAVAQEFVDRASAIDIPEEGEEETFILPDPSLSALLEQISLVADSDQIPDDDEGVVTLMTLHTAKGLEFKTAFLTGVEDGVFPHSRVGEDEEELAEERRLAYVGITRAMERLYLTRAMVRTTYGSPNYNPASRFIKEVPEELIDWRRTAEEFVGWRGSSGGADSRSSSSRGSSREGGTVFGSGRGPVKQLPSLAVGDRVLHSTFGLGKVLATIGTGQDTQVDVDFGSSGQKRLALRFAPLEKL